MDGGKNYRRKFNGDFGTGHRHSWLTGFLCQYRCASSLQNDRMRRCTRHSRSNRTWVRNSVDRALNRFTPYNSSTLSCRYHYNFDSAVTKRMTGTFNDSYREVNNCNGSTRQYGSCDYRGLHPASSHVFRSRKRASTYHLFRGLRN